MSNPEDNDFEENIFLVHLLISDRIANLKSQDSSNALRIAGAMVTSNPTVLVVTSGTVLLPLLNPREILV